MQIVAAVSSDTPAKEEDPILDFGTLDVRTESAYGLHSNIKSFPYANDGRSPIGYQVERSTTEIMSSTVKVPKWGIAAAPPVPITVEQVSPSVDD